jgi:ABC-type transport system involved in cytochrome c biogenesis permease subunit
MNLPNLFMFRTACVAAALVSLGGSVAHADEFTPQPEAVALDQALDYSDARLLVVLDRNRHKTLESFARESFSAMYGEEALPGLSPIGSVFEWLFNRDAYVDEPVIKIRPLGLRYEFTAHMPRATQNRVQQTKLMTLREYLDPEVQSLIQRYEPRFDLVSAIRKVRDAERTALHLERIIQIVPPPLGDATDPWHTPDEAVGNILEGEAAHGELASQFGPPIPGLSRAEASQIVDAWLGLRQAWLARDAAQAQEKLDALAAVLPQVGAAGVYPSMTQRQAEAKYYAMGKFTWGWVIYFAGTLLAVWAFITRWRWVRLVAIVLLIGALGVHAYGLGLRWYILGRIPVANMFEAVVASAWMGIAAALIIEWIYRTRVLLIAAGFSGFVALIMGQYVIPGGGTLTAIVAILDDVMLRIHTTLIIFSYALIFLAAVVAIVYLAVYYFQHAPARASEAGFMIAAGGLACLAMLPLVFTNPMASASYVRVAGTETLFAGATVLAIVLLIVARWRRAPAPTSAVLAILVGLGLVLAIGNYGFIRVVGVTSLATGLVVAAVMLFGAYRQAYRSTVPATSSFAFAGGPAGFAPASDRPILAGGAPLDRLDRADNSPLLRQIDWSHLILLNMAFVLLFVGVILGAVWADYSWGRPWGWDPKETFALNTWLIYAILIHMRFVVRNKGLWTAWLSIVGCLMMLFNWVFVNFFVVGLHSYA